MVKLNNELFEHNQIIKIDFLLIIIIINKNNNLMTTNPINLDKKKSIYGLFQDGYTLLYCSLLIPISIYNLIYQTNIITWKLDLFSYIYFVITGIINLCYGEYVFVLHHIICLNLIFVGNYNNLNYNLWLSNCYLAEVSNIFLAMKNVIKHLEKFISNIKKIKTINDVLFVIGYFGVRICYIIPITIYYFMNHYNEIKYFNFIMINALLMILLNLYWGYLIIKKLLKLFSNEKIIKIKNI